jgi:hypothetical protein
MSALQFFFACITVPLIFLMIVTAHQDDKAIKWMFIVLAYLWPLAFLAFLCLIAMVLGGNPWSGGGKNDEDWSLLLLAIAIITLWAVPLGRAGGRKDGDGDSPNQ